MFHVILNSARNFFRDKNSVFFCIFFPSILVFLLGNLLSNYDTSDYEIGEIKIHYIISSDDEMSVNAAEEFLKGLDNQDVLKTEKSENLDDTQQLIQDEKLAGAIEFTGNPIKIVIHEGKDNVKNRTIEAIMHSFAESKNSVMSVIKENPQSLSQINMSSESKSHVIAKDLGVNRSMIDYYAVAMAVMTIFMCSFMSSSEIFFEERENKTINRLFISPANKTAVFIGKIMGALPMAVVQIIVIMVVSTVFFNAHYCATAANNILFALMMVVVCLAVNSFGSVIGLLMKKVHPGSVTWPFIWVLLFFSGTFSKEIYVEGFSNRLPTYIVQKAAFDLTVFGRNELTLKVIAASAVCFIVFTILGAVIFNKKEAE